MWVNEGARKHVICWSIGTVKIKEHWIYFPAAKFDEILFLFTHPSSRQNIERSKGYTHFKSEPFDIWCVILITNGHLQFNNTVSQTRGTHFSIPIFFSHPSLLNRLFSFFFFLLFFSMNSERSGWSFGSITHWPFDPK